MITKALFLTLFLFSLYHTQDNKDVYVSLNGQNDTQCTIDKPCLSIVRAYSLCKTFPNCTIYIDGSVKPYQYFLLNFMDRLVNVRITSYPSDSIVEFTGSGKNNIILIGGGEGDPINFEMNNIHFGDGYSDASGGCIGLVNFGRDKGRNFTLTLNNCSFKNCYADDFGGAIYVSHTVNVSMNVNSCYFENNFAANNGGAIYAETIGEFSITDSVFTQNKAKNGGSLLVQGLISIKDTSFFNNSVEEDGGAIYIQGPDTEGSLYNCTFISNIATSRGGAMFHTNNPKKVSLKNNKITNNQAKNRGSGVYVLNSNVSLNSSNIANNTPIVIDKNMDSNDIDIFCDSDTRKNYKNTCLFCTDVKVSKSCDICFQSNNNASCIHTIANTTVCFYNGGTCPIEINPLYSWIALASLVLLVTLVMIGVSIVLCRFRSVDGRDYQQI